MQDKVHKEILLRAIRKAVANGWEDGTIFSWNEEDYEAIIDWLLLKHQYRVLIFSPKFAQALWPMNYKHHLQQMVVADDQIEYLGGHS
jgi:hypothetical protein